MKRRHLWIHAFLIGSLGGVSAARADVSLPAVFGNDMVLQRDVAIPVWGWDAPGQEVTVTLAGQSVSATTGADGAWRVGGYFIK